MLSIPDFSRTEKKDPKRFVIDGYTYECSPVLPAGATRDLARITRLNATAANGDNAAQEEAGMEVVQALGDFMDAIMLPDSAAEFAKRIRDPLNPIDDEQIGKIVVWLIGEYGDRPTMQPSPALAGQSTTQPSTDGA